LHLSSFAIRQSQLEMVVKGSETNNISGAEGAGRREENQGDKQSDFA